MCIPCAPNRVTKGQVCAALYIRYCAVIKDSLPLPKKSRVVIPLGSFLFSTNRNSHPILCRSRVWTQKLKSLLICDIIFPCINMIYRIIHFYKFLIYSDSRYFYVCLTLCFLFQNLHARLMQTSSTVYEN